MALRNTGVNAYNAALQRFSEIEEKTKGGFSQSREEGKTSNGFAAVFAESLSKVNELQQQKADMITSFASGEQQNVHELMISLQKAGVAMQLTSAVRNKVLDAYRELSRLQF